MKHCSNVQDRDAQIRCVVDDRAVLTAGNVLSSDLREAFRYGMRCMIARFEYSSN
jgi:hypothetical protein